MTARGAIAYNAVDGDDMEKKWFLLCGALLMTAAASFAAATGPRKRRSRDHPAASRISLGEGRRRLVSADVDLGVEVPVDGFDHRYGHQRRTGVVEVDDRRGAGRRLPEALDVERHGMTRPSIPPATITT